MVYAGGSAIAAACVAIFGKLGLKDVDPTLATIVRAVVMALILIAAGFLFKKFEGVSLATIGSKAWLYIVLSACAGAASWLLYFVALRTGPVDAVAVIDKLSVVLVIFFAALFLGEAMTLKSALGVVLTVAGTLLILFK